MTRLVLECQEEFKSVDLEQQFNKFDLI